MKSCPTILLTILLFFTTVFISCKKNDSNTSQFPPTIFSFSPTTANTGDTVTIKGANLTGATMVRFGGIPATSFKIVSDTEILAIVGSGASGTVMIQSRDIYVEKPGFKMYTPPPIDSLFTIGQTYQGGIIFYIDSTLIHGLIAAPYNQSNGIIWWSDTTRTYADGRAIGTGMANTKKIVALFGDGLYAAKICDDLILNGYDDWFLPSQLELTELAKKNFLIGGFTDGWYWSSTDLGGEPHAFYAFNTHFPDGFVKLNTDMNKPSLNLVRAIRAF